LTSPHPLRNNSNGKLATVAVVLVLVAVESGRNHANKEKEQGRSQQQQQWLQQQQCILPLINNPLPHLWLRLQALSKRGVQKQEGHWLS
jgi:hypothetical protein